MPTSPAVWIILIVAAAAVVGLMVWKGVGGTFAKGKWKVTLHDAPKPPSQVTVARDMHVTGGKVGKITGVKADPSGNAAASNVDVASNADFSNTEVGDITGIDTSGSGERKK